MKLVAKHSAWVAKLQVLNVKFYRAWWCASANPVSAKLRQEDTQLEARLGYLLHPQRPYFYLGGV